MELRGRGPDALIDGRSARTCLLCLLAVLTVLLLPGLTTAKASGNGSTAADQAGSGSVTGTRLETPPEVALDSWTPADFQQAQPAEPPVGPAGAFDVPEFRGATTSAADGEFVPTNIEQYPLSTHGKVFFRVGSDEYVCSGTVVSSRGQNIIFTAGHCVYDTETSQFVDELLFVPAYDGAAADPEPFGVWAATAVFTTNRYVNSGQLSHDIGVVVVEDPVQDTVGARRIAFDLNPSGRKFTIYGYPARPNPPYDGETMIGCHSEAVNRDDAQGSPFPIAAGPCDMGSGSSGGGWITDAGYLNSVVSYGYCQDTPSLCGLTFGPYFTDQAKALYTDPAVGGSADPTVTIDSGPRGRVSGSAARFRLGGSGSTPISFRCRVDRGLYFRCGSTTTVRRLRRGPHVLRVYAVDQTGRTSPGIAVRRFSVTG